MKRQFLFQTCITLLLMAGPASAAWDISTVDSTGDVGLYTSIALDSDGHPHISYYDNTYDNLKYASFNGSTWDISTVDSTGDVGSDTSIALDSDDHPHISYYDATNGDLNYASFNGSTWDISTVDSTGDVGMYTSIALDSDGHPHISYCDVTNYDLKYASFNGSTWDISTIDSTGSVGSYTSIALDSDGHPHISYFDLGHDDLKYAAFNGSTWDISTVDSTGNVGIFTSIALDSDGHPHISYVDWNNDFLKYASFNGSTWDINTVDSTGNVGMHTSIALDSDGHPHISYYDNTYKDLKYAAFNGSTWEISTVDSTGDVGKYTSIALDSDDYPHISYYDNTYDNLKYAYYSNTAPVAEAGDDQAVIEIGSLIQLDGSESYDIDGDDITYSWTMSQKPDGSLAELSDPCAVDPNFIADIHGDYTVTLVVTDVFGAASQPDSVIVSFSNVKPVAVPGGNQAVVEGDTVYLDGSGSYDDNYDELSYNWNIVSKPPDSDAVLSNSNIADPCFVADKAGSYVISLVVNDGFVDSDAANVSVMAITNEAAATEELIDAIDTINSLDPSVFENRNLSGALTNKINAALELIDLGHYAEALNKLQNDILNKTNGCAETGAPDKNDWITTCSEQELVYTFVLEAIQYLEEAME